MNKELIRTTPLKGLVAARAGGAKPTDAYGQVIELIRQRCGEDTATLFAEPHPARSESGESALTWYTSLTGPLTALSDLDEVAREAVAAKLHERLEKLRPLLRDRQLGPMVASWLYVPSPEHILSIGGDPVLICWGHVPEDVAISPSKRAEHFAQTLGLYAEGFGAPPFTPQDALEYVQDNSAGAPFVPAAGISTAASARPSSWWARSRTPLIASAIAAIVLALLLIPGVLVYASLPDNAPVERLEALLRADNSGLAERLREYEEAGRQRICRLLNGQLSPLRPTQVPGRPGTSATPPNATPAEPLPRADLLPPPPDRVHVPRDPAAPAGGAPTTMNDLIEQAVVFIIGRVAGGPDQVGFGTGFFVTPDRIVTNRHVIEHLEPGTILVTNKKLGQAKAGRVVAKSSPPPDEDLVVRDLALLAVDSPGLAVLKLGPSIEKFSSVVAVGYPGFLVEDDPGYQKLRRGERSASPDNTIQYGFVIQKRDSGPVKQVTHSAPLGHGNSGGPLLDLCSRVVGVNTSVRNEGQIATSANFAQDVSELRAFLSENGITPQSNETAMTCPPVVAQAAPTNPPSAQRPANPAPPQPAPTPTPQPAPAPSR